MDLTMYKLKNVAAPTGNLYADSWDALVDNHALVTNNNIVPYHNTLAGATWIHNEYQTGLHYAQMSVSEFSGGGGGGGAGGAAAFPIELSTFTGRNAGATNILDWTTLSEQNASAFEVERSGTNAMFERIGSVQAFGNSNSLKDYTFTDIAPLMGKNIYRLKMVDVDGSFKYSPVVEIQMSDEASVSIYPNPTNGDLTVSVAGNVQGATSFELMNAAGQMVMTQTWGANSTAVHRLDVSKLAAGVYFYRVRNGKTVFEGKLVRTE
jgi:hypothetical protein